MKSRKLFFTATFLGIALILSGCANESISQQGRAVDSQIYEVYKAYLNNGGELSYTEWLATVKGEDGTSLLTGEGVPASTLGKDGDTYIDLSTFDLYTKASGAWTKKGNIKGSAGAAGTKGDTGLTGQTGPAGATGSQGPAGQTGATGQTGADGKAGSSVLSGSGVPEASLGSDGDTYLDIDTGDIYKKADGAWSKTGNIKGDTGATGQTGADGKAGYSSYIVDSVAKTFDIYDVFGLMSFRSNVNNGFTFEGWTVSLENNVDLENLVWSPIGTETAPFKGTFDGNDKTIDHLEINSTSDFQGLFGVLDGGLVTKTTFENVSLSGVQKTGSAVGMVINNGTVSYINVNSGTITAGLKTVGSCVGMIKAYGTVEHCTNNVDITSSGTNVGGIIGAAYYTEADQEMFVKNNTNHGNIIGGHPAGGIVGLSAANVSDNFNNGNVTGTIGTSTGGIVGEQKTYGTVRNNINEGNVVNSNVQYGVGGIIGWIRYHGTSETSSYKRCAPVQVIENTNKGSISGGYDGGGIVGVVYNNATLTKNINQAPTISGSEFAAGIVGNYQTVGTPADATITNSVTLSENTSSTTIENITANCKDLIIYSNEEDATHIVK